MTLPGGPADKLGNRYENRWTVLQLLRLLDGQIVSIRMEVPSVDKAEFVLHRGEWKEYHQARCGGARTNWSIASLTSSGILQSIKELLREEDSLFVFVSSFAAVDLAKLCDAARNAESDEEFLTKFLAAKGSRNSFEKIRDVWQCDPATAINNLRRIEVRTIGEFDLKEQIYYFSRAIYLADEDSVLSELSRVVEESIHQTLTRDDLVSRMRTRGFELRQVSNRQQAVHAVKRTTENFVNGARRRLIHHELVPRSASEEVASGVDESFSVIIGKAGTGKTTCTLEVIDRLLISGCQVLAFRLDRHTTAKNTRELGRRLGFEESPVMVLSAAAETTGSKSILVVDQLDSVSTMSGRNSEALDLVATLIEEVEVVRERIHLHIILVCRSFDWYNDHRLRQLTQDECDLVELGEFTEEKTKELLIKGGFTPTQFGEHQLRLLNLPQNLSLLMESCSTTPGIPRFNTVKELFDLYWDAKRNRVLERAPDVGDHWVEVLKLLSAEMNTTQELSVRKELLDGVPPHFLEQMASEGVLVSGNGRYGFGHESFFDYCFARLSYFRGSESLGALLRKTEQHLFRRGQVRQVLTYVRDADGERYLGELQELISDDRIRTHIKDLVFALLANVSEPTEREWLLWQEWTQSEVEALEEGTQSDSKIATLAWRHLFASETWFRYFVSHGVVKRWMDSDTEHLVQLAINYLRIHQRHSPDVVAELLVSYVDACGYWPRTLEWFAEWADCSESRSLFEIFLRLIDNGVLDDATEPIAMNSTFWDLVHPIVEKQPKWVGEVIAHRVRRRMSVLKSEGVSIRKGDLLGHDLGESDMLLQVANSDPLVFVKQVLPVVLEASEATVMENSPPYREQFGPIELRPHTLTWKKHV